MEEEEEEEAYRATGPPRLAATRIRLVKKHNVYMTMYTYMVSDYENTEELGGVWRRRRSLEELLHVII